MVLGEYMTKRRIDLCQCAMIKMSKFRTDLTSYVAFASCLYVCLQE